MGPTSRSGGKSGRAHPVSDLVGGVNRVGPPCRWPGPRVGKRRKKGLLRSACARVWLFPPDLFPTPGVKTCELTTLTCGAQRLVGPTCHRGAAHGHGRMRVRPSRDRDAVSGGARERGTGADGWGPARGGYAPRVGVGCGARGWMRGALVSEWVSVACASASPTDGCGATGGEGRDRVAGDGPDPVGWWILSATRLAPRRRQYLCAMHLYTSAWKTGPLTYLQGHCVLIPSCLLACFISGRVLHMLKNYSLRFILNRFNFFHNQVLLSLIIL